MGNGWFERNVFGTGFPAKLQSVYYNLQESRKEPESNDFRERGLRTVMGFLVPPFQRQLVWTEAQKIAFLDSARRCIPLGSYTVNKTFGNPIAHRMDGAREYYYGDGFLLDGQQRLNSLEEFFDDKLRVHGMVWSELSKDDQRQFLGSVNFNVVETEFGTEAAMRRYYDLMNFGGTAHREHERAYVEVPESGFKL